MLPNFALVRSRTIQEAIVELAPEATPYAGGTELLMAMKIGLLQPSRLIDLKPIAALRSIRVEGDELIIGAGATHHQIARDDQVRQHAPLLADVEERVGNPRVRSVGTIGGNLCFAEPKSDVATALIALDAEVVLESAAGTRRMAVDDFTLGPYFTAREDNELLTEVRIHLGRVKRGVYLKYQTMERPTVGVALVDAVAMDGTARRSIVVGAVGERPVRFDFDPETRIDPREIADMVEPLPDLTGSVRYKRHIVAVYVQRAVESISSEER